VHLETETFTLRLVSR